MSCCNDDINMIECSSIELTTNSLFFALELFSICANTPKNIFISAQIFNCIEESFEFLWWVLNCTWGEFYASISLNLSLLSLFFSLFLFFISYLSLCLYPSFSPLSPSFFPALCMCTWVRVLNIEALIRKLNLLKIYII